MPKYNLYALGNALVDFEFELDETKLSSLAIDKGVMTLIDEERHHHLVSELAPHEVKKACGGSSANTAIAVRQFGGQSFYSCRVANDDSGLFYLEDLQRCGVDTNIQANDRPDGVTGKCLVFVTPDADRTMNTHLGIAAEFSQDELVPEAIADSDYLYIEGYLVSSPTGKAAAIKARDIAQKAGVKTSLSLSDPNMVSFFKGGLLEMIGDGLDFLFANETEALKLADTQDIQEAIAHCQTLAKQFAITRGAQGSLIFDGDSIIELDAVPVKAIDTVGAGDMYAGALLYGITHGMTLPDAGKLASKASARIVSHLGPRLAAEETRSLLLS
ncbi:adenosine kinase [Geitlerinema sp. P-1104]|uniref:adenosine kinase n=1 Tax=Geitlerinema sp. P-1104 TaxID=2546230 RepID=UPI001980EF2C|nr:adenosine kinase [Geitlerinema sp. P-1104]